MTENEVRAFLEPVRLAEFLFDAAVHEKLKDLHGKAYGVFADWECHKNSKDRIKGICEQNRACTDLADEVDSDMRTVLKITNS